MTSKRKTIAVLSPPTRETLQGISRYSWPDRAWNFVHSPPTKSAIMQLIEQPPDGLIGYFWTDELVALAQQIQCPKVNFSGAIEEPGMPQVTVDNERAGRMAADYLLERGFRNFGFVGDRTTSYSADREEGFMERLHEKGFNSEWCYLQVTAYPAELQRNETTASDLLHWVGKLPKSTAVFAANDRLAWWVEESALQLGRRIPEDIAVLGMDNMALSVLARPPLSSVIYPADRIGYKAAAMLDELMAGNDTETMLKVWPEGIITRHSTDVIAVEDVHVSRALRFVQDNYGEQITVDQLARAASVNRRTLEKRFRSLLGRSPLDEIRRVRVEKAQELLIESDMGLDDIAELCGFSGRRWFSKVFHQRTGMSPVQYRDDNG